MFFSQEKNQKTFASGAHGWIQAMAGQGGGGGDAEVFCFFYSEKKSLA
jgi:hypothetical protein